MQISYAQWNAIYFKNNCSNRYIQLGESTVSYGCDKNLVYYPSYISYKKESYDNRIASINRTLTNTMVDTYIYYIEKDTDIDFTTNEKSDIYDYLKNNINSDKIYLSKPRGGRRFTLPFGECLAAAAALA